MEKSNIRDTLCNEFGVRLQKLLNLKGYKNNRRPYYVDVIRFAKEVGCSAQQLRKYLAGSMMPKDAVIEAMAKMLEVDPYYLFCGYKFVHQNALDFELIKTIFNKMRELLVNSSPEQYIKHIDYACNVYSKLLAIQVPNELERRRLMNWMLSELIENKTKGELMLKESV